MKLSVVGYVSSFIGKNIIASFYSFLCMAIIDP